jgi:ribonuclease HII
MHKKRKCNKKSPEKGEGRKDKMDDNLLELERALWERGYTRIAGIDEAGRGPLAGPVVAAACILPRDFNLPGLRDSKKLTPGRREALAAGIQDQAVAWSVASVNARDIEALNILRATLKAMCQAVCGLVPGPEALLIDGRDTLDKGQLVLCQTQGQAAQAQAQGQGCPGPDGLPASKRVMVSGEAWGRLYQQAVVGGDARCASIAAASVLAKVARDRIMTEYSEIYPGYGFDKHKGYGTREHMEALQRLGPCPLHRMSFAPLKKLG